LDFGNQGSGGIPTQGLVAEWLFEDDTLDTSGTGNDGTLSGATFVDGKIGRALDFDGVNDIVTVSNDPTLNFGTGSLSISAWIKTTDTNAWIVEHRRNNDGDYRGWDLDITTGEASGRILDGLGSDVFLKSADITDDVFHHVVYVVDRSTQTALIYLDGVLENTADVSSVGNIDQNTMGINIGYTSSPNTPNSAYDGIIDQIRIYDRALSQSEVTALANES